MGGASNVRPAVSALADEREYKNPSCPSALRAVFRVLLPQP